MVSASAPRFSAHYSKYKNIGNQLYCPAVPVELKENLYSLEKNQFYPAVWSAIAVIIL